MLSICLVQQRSSYIHTNPQGDRSELQEPLYQELEINILISY